MIRPVALVFTLALSVPLCADALAQAAPADDVVGLELGMSFDESSALLKKMDDVELTETAAQWIRQSHGLPTRQLLRASDGRACEGKPARQRGWQPFAPCNTDGGRFQARQDIGNEIIVAFAGMPGQEEAISIWRHTQFKAGEQPAVSAVEQALMEKYGKPNIRQTESGYYSMAHRHGAIALDWVYAPNGKLITDSTVKSRCVNGPKPWFRAKHSWNAGCGLTIRAEVLPVPGQRLLAQELNVTVVRQDRLMKALKTFDAELKAAVEGASKQVPKPKL